jgi:predicted DCC family thiol-disulfide oxidoreductase YuxK
MAEAADRAAVIIYYDGDCPCCSDYVRHLRLKEAVGAPRLVDLREAPEGRAALEAEGLDLDQGMVADIGGVRHAGADALSALALLTTRSGLFNRATAALFSRPAVARLAYPLLRAGRNTLLTLLGREPFRADDGGWQALFIVFSQVFGLFAILHFFIYAFRYTAFEIYPTTWMILVLGVALYLRPGSARVFALLLVVMTVDAWLHAPKHSNHAMLRNFLLLAFLGSGVWHLLKGSRWSDFFRDAVPVGRVLLLVMYFYGVFHKINAGFLDPEVSCAVALWRVMPWPIRLLDHPVVHYLTIWGTFVVETAIAAMLVTARLRDWGIVLGIGFHGMLAFSGFAMYPAFTTLTIALHVLFLSPRQALRIVGAASFRVLQARLRSWQGGLLLAMGLPLIALLAITRDYNTVAFVWLALAAPLLIAILLPAEAPRPAAGPERHGPLLWSRLGWLNAIGVLFFLNGAMPYLGLKTAQAMNMFANLRLEGGVSNHLVLPWAPGPFGYLEDVVEVIEAEGDRRLEWAAGSGHVLVYYDLLDRLDRAPEASVTFVRGGDLHEARTRASLAGDIEAILHPEWVRKWFHFRSNLLEDRPACF